MHKHMSPHGDYDHIGGSINLINNFKVDNVILIVLNLIICKNAAICNIMW